MQIQTIQTNFFAFFRNFFSSPYIFEAKPKQSMKQTFSDRHSFSIVWAVYTLYYMGTIKYVVRMCNDKRSKTRITYLLNRRILYHINIIYGEIFEYEALLLLFTYLLLIEQNEKNLFFCLTSAMRKNDR